jgi:hypothetical protein
MIPKNTDIMDDNVNDEAFLRQFPNNSSLPNWMRMLSPGSVGLEYDDSPILPQIFFTKQWDSNSSNQNDGSGGNENDGSGGSVSSQANDEPIEFPNIYEKKKFLADFPGFYNWLLYLLHIFEEKCGTNNVRDAKRKSITGM